MADPAATQASDVTSASGTAPEAPDVSAAIEAASASYGDADAGDATTGQQDAAADTGAQDPTEGEQAGAEPTAPEAEAADQAQLAKDIATLARIFGGSPETPSDRADEAAGSHPAGHAATPSTTSPPSQGAAGQDAGGVPSDFAEVFAATDAGLREAGFPEVADSLKPLNEAVSKTISTLRGHLQQVRNVLGYLAEHHIKIEEEAVAQAERSFEKALKGLGEHAKDRYGVGVPEKDRTTEQKKARAALRDIAEKLWKADVESGAEPDAAEIWRRADNALRGIVTPSQAKQEVVASVVKANKRLSTPPGIPGTGRKPAAQSREAAIAEASKFYG
jgi:hypothetical protein